MDLRLFVVNAHTSPFDLSVFGFEPQPIVAATNRAAKPTYRGKVSLQPGEAKVLKFTPPKKVVAAIRRALRAKGKATRRLTFTYRTATGQSQTVTRKLVVKR